MRKNKIWRNTDEIAKAVMTGYSISDKKKIREQYLHQVSQYPLYNRWFDLILEQISLGDSSDIVEYGSGPGVLAGRLRDNPHVRSYVAIEPGEVFREMTLEQFPNAEVVNGTAEAHLVPESFDIAIATATYHHFQDKVLALENIYQNLKPGGQLIIADGFLPEYEFDANFNPVDKSEFVSAVMKYTAAQIKLMPNPTEADIEDQMRTAILDRLRIEELKVCHSILIAQLNTVGNWNTISTLMSIKDERVDYCNLGWWFTTARKK